MIKPVKMFVIAILTALVIACTATSTSESTGEYLDSSAITSKVKASLMEQLGTQGFAIKVKTFKDDVQLSGFVNNNDLKRRAGDIASQVGDVKRVRNDIIVK